MCSYRPFRIITYWAHGIPYRALPVGAKRARRFSRMLFRAGQGRLPRPGFALTLTDREGPAGFHAVRLVNVGGLYHLTSDHSDVVDILERLRGLMLHQERGERAWTRRNGRAKS